MPGWNPAFYPYTYHWCVCNQIVALSLHNNGYLISVLLLKRKEITTCETYYNSFFESTLTSPGGLEMSHHPVTLSPFKLRANGICYTDLCFIAIASLKFLLKSYLFNEVYTEPHLIVQPWPPPYSPSLFYPVQLFSYVHCTHHLQVHHIIAVYCQVVGAP